MIKVDYITHMGSDLLVVNAARVSFNKWKDKLDARDVRLIGYLARMSHFTPFAHPQLTFRVTAPIFVARQLAKHQVGGVWNEVSRRYVDDPPEFFEPETWRKRSPTAKQGSLNESIDLPQDANSELFAAYHRAWQAYDNLLELGVCPEQARMVLPQGVMTTWIWTGSLMFFARVVRQRTDEHAQRETAEVARQIDRHIRQLKDFEHSWEALVGDGRTDSGGHSA